MYIMLNIIIIEVIQVGPWWVQACPELFNVIGIMGTALDAVIRTTVSSDCWQIDEICKESVSCGERRRILFRG